ncbi:MAG: hypothetical protein LBM93_08155, partial [Oscillospiraceae bacterium]|nr:hypothetical protein [Oscillospiraceae bacterium]
RLLAEKIDLEDKINNKMLYLASEKILLTRFIIKLKDENIFYANLLIEKYMHNLTNNKIAEKNNYSTKQIQRLLNKAVDSLENLIKDDNENEQRH